jgi:hypothetical protein
LSVATPSDWHDRSVAGRDAAGGHLLPNLSLYLVGNSKMTMRRVATAAAVAGLLVGCGESGPALVPVHGTVTLNGKPLEGALVSFQPDASMEDAIPAEDVTGPNGNYKALTKGRSGVMPGKYKVVVSKSLIEMAKVRPEFKDDPFMAQLSLGPNEGKSAAQRDKEKIEGTFEREITEGGVQDFDVKRKE